MQWIFVGEKVMQITFIFPDDVLFSRRGRMGKILSPRHTLPPNTTCTYYFHGQPGDLIWISFTSYNLQILQHAIQDNNTLGRVIKIYFDRLSHFYLLFQCYRSFYKLPSTFN